MTDESNFLWGQENIGRKHSPTRGVHQTNSQRVGVINQRAINWSTQPLVSATTAVNQVNRLQQQIVENQVSTWPTRYLVLGGFTPGTPVSTPFFQKIRKEHTKEKIKRDKRFEKTKLKQNAKVTENKFLSRFLIKRFEKTKLKQ